MSVICSNEKAEVKVNGKKADEKKSSEKKEKANK